MSTKLLSRLASAVFLTLAVALRAADAPAPAAGPGISQQVQEIVAKINAKLQKGLNKESDLADEIAAFNRVIAAHKSEKTNEVATAEYMKDALYIQVLEEPAKGLAAFKQLAKDYPDTKVGQEVAKLLPQLEAQIAAQAKAEEMKRNLVVGKPFPEFAVAAGPVKDIAGAPLSVAQYKGKVVLIDFWATWCGPCMEEMPNVIAAYNKYHARGFDIIGVSLDQPEGLATLPAFLKEHQMPWRQYCDGKFWSNELAVKYGIISIPASYLLDGTGKIIAVSPRGALLAPAIEAALAAAGKK